MSLPVLAGLVVFGIALVVAVIHLTGGSRGAKLASADHAVSRFAVDFPAETVERVVLTASGDTAFLALSTGRTGIVHAIGDRFLTRIVSPADIASSVRVGEAGISVRFIDFTFGGGNYSFAGAAEADRVMSRLRAGRNEAVEPA